MMNGNRLKTVKMYFIATKNLSSIFPIFSRELYSYDIQRNEKSKMRSFNNSKDTSYSYLKITNIYGNRLNT